MRQFDHVKTVVVKVGTNLLTCSSGIDTARIDSIVDQLSALRDSGLQVLLVTSGAIGMGRRELGITEAVTKIEMRQACAAIGQPILMSSYRSSFARHGIVCSQVLLTRDEMNNRRTYVNLRNSVNTLLELGVVPVFNENDVISTREIGTTFGDNDQMAALIASKIDAQLLIILSDIPGLFTADPRRDPWARLLTTVGKIDRNVLAYAGGAGSRLGTGGMKSKLSAAQIAGRAGCGCIIASGYEDNALPRILAGEEIGTWIVPETHLSQRQRWILNNTHKGSILVDDGAKKALLKHKSLLPKGVVRVEGIFDRGDVVHISDNAGTPFAKAVVYYSSTQIAMVAGKDSRDLAGILGEGYKDVLFRPDDIVFTEPADTEGREG